MNTPYGPLNLVAATTNLSRREIVVGLGFGGVAAALAASGWHVKVQAQETTPETAMADLNALLVVYNHPEDPAAFQEYLLGTHLPLVSQVPNIQQLIVHSGIVTVDGEVGDIYQLGTVISNNQADLEEALASEAGQAAIADVANFATGGFSAYLCTVQTLSPADLPTPEATPLT